MKLRTERYSTATIKPIWTAFTVLCTVILILAITGGTRPTTQAATPFFPNASGEYHLMVNLQTSRTYRPEGEISRAAGERQRNDIARQQDALVASLPDGVTVERAFVTIPTIAVIAENDRALQALQRLDMVESVSANGVYELHLAETTDVIDVDNAWSAGFTGSGVAVAILDTGVDTSHPFLAGRVVHEACFSSAAFPNATSLCPNGLTQQTGTGAASPAKCNGVGGCSHGTHVAGIAAGSGTAFDGVAFNAGIIAIQVFSRVNDVQTCDGSPPCLLTNDSDYIAALEYIHLTLANQYNIASANMSLGGSAGYTTDCDSLIPGVANIVSNLRNQHDIATVISAGNSGYTNAVSAPGCVSSAITVGSSTDSDSVYQFHNRGPLVELMAPGAQVRSSVIGGGYEDYWGTSMAAPHVAGAWAVVRSMPQYANASVTEVLTYLEEMAVTISDSNYSYSRLNFTPPTSTTEPPSECSPNKLCLLDGSQILELDAVDGWTYLNNFGWIDRVDGLINNTNKEITLYDYDGQGYYSGDIPPGATLSSLGGYNNAADAILMTASTSVVQPSPTETPPSGCSANKLCLLDGSNQVLELDGGSGWVYLDGLGWENRVDGLINNTASTVSLYDYDGQGYHSNPSTLVPGTNLSTLGGYNNVADAVYIP